jgi:hypothetical protein
MNPPPRPRYVAQRVQNAVRPNFVTRREVLTMISNNNIEKIKNTNKAAAGGGDDDDEAKRAARILAQRMKLDTGALTEALGLNAPQVSANSSLRL